MRAMPEPRKLTYEDYCRFPDDGRRHEILDGVHYVSPSPLDRHQLVLRNLSTLFHVFLRESRLGEYRFAPSDVFLGEHDIVQPDLYVLRAKSLGKMEPKGCRGAPDLVIEVLSPSTTIHDLRRKKPRYQALGVREYWVVDPLAQRVEVYRREGDGAPPQPFARPELLLAEREDRLATPLFPGLDFGLDEVFDPGMTPEAAWAEDSPGRDD